MKVTDGWTVPGFIHVRELGGGSSGQVFQAVDDVTGTEVAIKYLSDRLLDDGAFITRFREESRQLSLLEDPNIVDFYQYVESPPDGRAAIVMELVDGVSLRKVLATQGPTGPLGALAALSGSLLALAAAHAAGIVHRDYKPANVLVRRDGLSKVLDFGIASRAGGAPEYLAPEQWLSAPPDPAADLYAATAVFFECLTGQIPYPAQSATALETAHRSGPIPIESVPGPLRDLVARGLAKDPAARPASAAEFLGELDDAAVAAYGPAWETQGRDRLAEMTSLAAVTDWTPPSPRTSPQPTDHARPGTGAPRRPGVLIGAGVLAVIVAAAGVAWYGASADQPGHKVGDTGKTASPPPSRHGSQPPAPSPATPDELAARISKAVSEKKTASFTYRRAAGGNDAVSATGVFRFGSKAATAYDMTVWNPAGGADSSKKLRTILVGGIAYVASGGWHPAPAVRVATRRDAPHVYGSMAANTRWATSTYNVLALLHASPTVKAVPWTPANGGGVKGLSYSGVASPTKLGQEPMVGPLYDQYTDGRFRVTYTVKVGADHLPQRLDVKLQSVAIPSKQTIFHIVYSRWGRKAAITAPA
jgi:serine/threonine protein kinase